MRQRQRQYSRSPYLSASKAKDSTFFPKIHKADLLDRPNFMQKSPMKSPYSNYNDDRLRQKQRNIEMAQKVVQLNPQRISESSEYRTLVNEIQKLQRQNKQEIQQIQQRKAKIEKKIKEEQSVSYKAKNQILDLEALLTQEQQLLDSCQYRLGFRPAEPTGQPDQSQYEGNQ